MRPVTLTTNLDNAASSSIAPPQTAPAAGNLVLTPKASAVDSSGAARILVLTATANEAARTFTFTGTDADGNTISEILVGPNAASAPTVNAYKTVSSIYVNNNTVGVVSVGTSSSILVAESKTVVLDFYSRNGVTVAVEVTGTVNYTVRETFDDILGLGTANAVWYNPPAFTGKTSNTVASLDVGATGMDIQINSYSNGATVVARIITVHSTVG
jgi:hypothetical protein